MSESMIERVAAAARDAVRNEGGSGKSVSFEEMSIIVARAVIASMREPTELMDREGQRGKYQKYGGVITTWQAMIDAALSEGRE